MAAPARVARYAHMAIHPYPAHLVTHWQLPSGADVTRTVAEDGSYTVLAADLVIGGVLIPGASAPRLVRRDMLREIRVALLEGNCAWAPWLWCIRPM